MGVVLLVAPYADYLPNAAMAGILFLVAWGLIDFHHIRQILRASRSESAILVTTFLATLFVELEFAILLGVILSLVVYLSRTSRPAIHSLVPDPSDERHKLVANPNLPECPQLKIVRIDGSLFFGAVNHVEERLQSLDQRQPEQTRLLLVGSGINFVDIAGAEMLVKEAKRRRLLGGGLYLCKIKDEVCRILKRGGFINELDDKHVFNSKAEAIHELVIKTLDPERCRKCDRRIFSECATMPKPAQ